MPLEDQEVSAYVMNELYSSPTGTSSTLDYAVLYTLFQALEELGLISRKSDSTSTQRFMTWLGFGSFKTRFSSVFTPKDEEEKQSYHSGLDRFVKELISQLWTSKDILSSDSYKALKLRFVNDASNPGTIESRKLTCQIVKYVLVYSGIIEKVSQNDRTIGYNWICPFTKELERDGDLSINEREYFDERRKALNIEFKKEPPRALTQAFEVSTFYHFIMTIEQWICYVQRKELALLYAEALLRNR